MDRSELDRKPLHRRHFSAHFAIIILTSVIFVTPVGIEVAAPLDQPTRVLIVSLRVSLPSVLCIVEIVVKLKDSRKRRATLSGRLMWEEPVWGSGEGALRAGQFWVAHSPVRTARMTCYFTSPHGPASEMVRFRAATIKKSTDKHLRWKRRLTMDLIITRVSWFGGVPLSILAGVSEVFDAAMEQ